MPRNLQNKVIVITGGSSGIGAATAVECAKAGMSVCLAARREDKLRQVADQVEQHGATAMTITCDVRNDDDVRQLIQQTYDRFQRLDVVFANAGYGFFSSVLAMTEQQHRDIFETNYFGTIRCVREAVPFLRKTTDGLKQLLICSSAASEIGLPMFGAYSATKAAQDSIAGALRAELAREGIHVTSVHPIGTSTEFFKTAGRLSGIDNPYTNTPPKRRQSVEHVAGRIISAIRKPRAEVWPMPIARIGLGLATIVPEMTNHAMKYYTRKKLRELGKSQPD